MSDLSIDDETCPNSDGTCPDADGTASIEQGDDGVAKLDAQARAEIEDAERSRAVSGDAAAEVDSGTGGTEKTPQEPRECADDEIIYGFEFCGKPDSTMLGETMFDYNGEPIGWIVANGPKGDCGWGSTFCPQCGGDLLTDEEPRKFGVTVEQMAKASTDFFDNLPSVNGKNGDFLPTTAEDEDANCKKADSLQDSREKLEADITTYLLDKVATWSKTRYELNNEIIGWLDRQAAITQAEDERTCHDCTMEQVEALQERVDALEAENARLRSRISDDAEYSKLVMGEYRDLRAKVDELTEERDTYRDNMKSLEWRADRLEAELRDTEGQLKTQRHNALQAQDALRIRREKHEASRMEYVELQAENAKLREKLDEIEKVVKR